MDGSTPQEMPPSKNGTTNGQPTSSANSLQKESQEHRCGWGSFSPDCCQKLHNPVFLCITASVLSGLQGMTVNGFISTSITTLEKKFFLTSTQSGIIVAMYDLAIVLVLIPVTYFGGKGHKGRWLGVGVLIFGLGSVVCSLPQFLTGKYTYEAERESLCDHGTNLTDPCTTEEEEGLENMFYFFLLGQALHGLGCAALFTLTFVYLDENSSRGTSALLTGVFYGVNIIGAAVGYLMAGAFLNIYGDFYQVDSVDLEPEDPQWYGAWWIGFLVSALIAFTISIPMFGFARELPDGAKYKAENEKHNSNLGSLGEKTVLKDLGASLKLLLCNPTFMFLVLADGVDTFLLNGFISFAPKVLEQQYGATASQASIYGGLAVVPGGGGGCIVGGLIIKKFKMGTVGIIRFGACMFLVSLAFMFIFLMSCDQPPLVGMHELNRVSGLDSSLLSNISACNQDCGCWNKMYDPVCDPSGEFRFYSPCHAGCTTELGDDEFMDCRCVTSPYQNISTVLPSSECKSTCVQVIPFICLLFCGAFFTFMAAAPNIQGILRSVHYDLRSLATGVGWIGARVLGNLPAPVAIGAVIDRACLVWTQDCGQGKKCLIYDNYEMRRNLTIIAVCFRAVSTTFFFLASVFYRPPQGGSPEDDISVTIGKTDSSASQMEVTTGEEQSDSEPGLSNPVMSDDIVTNF